MIILGVDPGTIKTGYGLIFKDGGRMKALNCGIIKMNSKSPIAERLTMIYNGLLEVIREFQPDVIALEDVFFSTNVKSAIRIGEARSVVMLLSGLNDIELAEYKPTRVKQSVVGNGRASKQQVQGMVKVLLGLKEAPPEDASDALAVALCYCHMQKGQIASL